METYTALRHFADSWGLLGMVLFFIGAVIFAFRPGSRARADEAAKQLKITAQDLLRLGVVDTVVPEPPGGAHQDPAAAASMLGEALQGALDTLADLDGPALAEHRFQRFRKLGAFVE